MCDCKREIERGLLQRFKEARPEAKEHEVTLEGYGLSIVGKTMLLRPYMVYTAHAHYPRKAGGTTVKKNKGTLVFSFCPFCGEKLDGTAPANG